MAFSKSHNLGNPHLGLFCCVSERLAVIDVSASQKFVDALLALETPLVRTTFGGAGFCGIFIAMNSNGAIVPQFCGKDEAQALEDAGLNVFRLPGKFSACGNNIAANDFGAVANPDIPRGEIRKVADCLGVEVVQFSVAGYDTVGSCVLPTNKGFLAHNRASQEELKELQSILRVEGRNCTLNSGVAFVSLCAVANSKAGIFGEASTGFEVGRAADLLNLA